MHAEARHLCRFVAGNCGENPRARRISTVSLFKVPDLHLKNKNRFSLVAVHSSSCQNVRCVLGIWAEAVTYKRVYSLLILSH